MSTSLTPYIILVRRTKRSEKLVNYAHLYMYAWPFELREENQKATMFQESIFFVSRHFLETKTKNRVKIEQKENSDIGNYENQIGDRRLNAICAAYFFLKIDIGR